MIILGVKESLFVYKDTPEFLRRIYADKSLMYPGQGYASVYFEGETDEEQHKSKSDNPQVVLDSIMEHAACCIYWKNREGVYMGCNSMEAEILGFQSPDEVIGKTDFDLSWKKISSILRESDQRVMKTGKPEQIMEYPILANGKQAIMLTTKAPLYDNNKNIVGIVGTSIDVTDSYRVNDLAREYERQQLDLQQHRQFKKMIYQISHDLLSPLVSLKYFEKSCEEVSSENMNILRTAIDSIDGILKAMLDHYRNDNFSESGTMKQNILVSPAISEIVTQKQAEYSHKHFVQGEDKHGNFAVITYTPSPDCYDLCIECDLYSFKRMLSNLINNAVESVDNKIAEVNIKLYKENKQVRIDVCDNGRGIPPVIAGQIMQKEKDASVTTKIGGYGLGISQIQNTVEQYNGRININSQAQSGAEPVGIPFTVNFPKGDNKGTKDTDWGTIPATGGGYGKGFINDQPVQASGEMPQSGYITIKADGSIVAYKLKFGQYYCSTMAEGDKDDFDDNKMFCSRVEDEVDVDTKADASNHVGGTYTE